MISDRNKAPRLVGEFIPLFAVSIPQNTLHEKEDLQEVGTNLDNTSPHRVNFNLKL